MGIPAEGFISSTVPDGEVVNRPLPVPYEATWREGGDGSDLVVGAGRPHVERAVGPAEADVEKGPDASGATPLVATLKRNEAYGAVLLDSFTGEGEFSFSEVEGLFFGDDGGDTIHQFGLSHQDSGTPVGAKALTREIAPGGTGGSAVFHNVYLVLTYRTAGELTFTPVLDGARLTDAARTFHVGAGVEPVTEEFELPLRLPYDPTGAEEELRYAPEGTWFQVQIEAEDVGGIGGELQIEAAELEVEVVREQHPGTTFTVEPLADSALTPAHRVYFGAEGGDDIWEFGQAHDDGGAPFAFRSRTVQLAAAGASREGVFRTLWLALTRSNATDMTLELTPIVDGEEKTVRTIDLPGVAGPVTAVFEVPLMEAFVRDGVEELRSALRGTWLSVELEGTLPDGDLVVEGFEVDVEVATETEAPVG